MSSFHTYTYPDARSVVVCGDIHGEFNAVVYKLCVEYKLTDTLLVIAGDCGFGFDKPGYYDNVFDRISSRLREANNWVLMIRGNHDDPTYFQEQLIHYDRFRCIPDYSIISACGHTVLCVGGAISLDRDLRKRHDSQHYLSGIASYWADEVPVYDGAAIDEIGKEYRIDTVITHTAPSFCERLSKDGLSGWAARDSDLLADCAKERETMDRIYAHLKSAAHPVSHWYYGHFHQSWCSEIDGILFSMLDILEFKELI